ncbi:MAG: metallophosphoesterase [Chlamydiales bacterium]|nr:metallophosphoesterase [Chlamydiia bacterium]MCP5508351.1 metallophosphoesterase [Chlamydiales bacterium]
MTVWALADLHLSFGVPDKKMDVFGEHWHNHPQKIEKHWREKISNDDLVLLPGDISWAKHLEDAIPDLQWIDALPGTKVMIRGNHDFWWHTKSKVLSILPPSIHIIQNDAFNWNDISIGGARLWDTDEYSFDNIVHFVENDKVLPLTEKDLDPKRREHLFERELQRLKMSLDKLDQNASHRIVMTHYPPIATDMKDSRASALIEKYNVDAVVFGHIHNIYHDLKDLFGMRDNTRYVITSADYVDFNPVKII